MKWWFFGRGSEVHHSLVPREHIKRALEDVCFQSVNLFDWAYLEVDEKTLEEVVDEGFYGVGAKYHGLSGEFPDCDDYARVCVGDFIRECVRRGYLALPPFGIARISFGERKHLMCVGVAEGKVKFYEPQNRKWLTPGEVGGDLVRAEL